MAIQSLSVILLRLKLLLPIILNLYHIITIIFTVLIIHKLS